MQIFAVLPKVLLSAQSSEQFYLLSHKPVLSIFPETWMSTSSDGLCTTVSSCFSESPTAGHTGHWEGCIRSCATLCSRRKGPVRPVTVASRHLVQGLEQKRLWRCWPSD